MQNLSKAHQSFFSALTVFSERMSSERAIRIDEDQSVTKAAHENEYQYYFYLQTCTALIVAANNGAVFFAHCMAGKKCDQRIADAFNTFTQTNGKIRGVTLIGGDETFPSIITRDAVKELLCGNSQTRHLSPCVMITNHTSKLMKLDGLLRPNYPRIGFACVCLPTIIKLQMDNQQISFAMIAVFLVCLALTYLGRLFLDDQVRQAANSDVSTTVARVAKNSRGLFLSYESIHTGNLSATNAIREQLENLLNPSVFQDGSVKTPTLRLQ